MTGAIRLEALRRELEQYRSCAAPELTAWLDGTRDRRRLAQCARDLDGLGRAQTVTDLLDAATHEVSPRRRIEIEAMAGTAAEMVLRRASSDEDDERATLAWGTLKEPSTSIWCLAEASAAAADELILASAAPLRKWEERATALSELALAAAEARAAPMPAPPFAWIGAARGWDPGELAKGAAEVARRFGPLVRTGLTELARTERSGPAAALSPGRVARLSERLGMERPVLDGGDAPRFLRAVFESLRLYVPDRLVVRPWGADRGQPPRALPEGIRIRLGWSDVRRRVPALRDLLGAAGEAVAAAYVGPLPIELERGRNGVLRRAYRYLFAALPGEAAWSAEIFWHGVPRGLAEATALAIRIELVTTAFDVIAQAGSEAGIPADILRARQELWREHVGVEAPLGVLASALGPHPAAAEALAAAAFAAQLRGRAMSRWGRAWWRGGHAARELSELFENGGRDTAGEIARALWGGGIEIEALLEEGAA